MGLKSCLLLARPTTYLAFPSIRPPRPNSALAHPADPCFPAFPTPASSALGLLSGLWVHPLSLASRDFPALAFCLWPSTELLRSGLCPACQAMESQAIPRGGITSVACAGQVRQGLGVRSVCDLEVLYWQPLRSLFVLCLSLGLLASCLARPTSLTLHPRPFSRRRPGYHHASGYLGPACSWAGLQAPGRKPLRPRGRLCELADPMW